MAIAKWLFGPDPFTENAMTYLPSLTIDFDLVKDVVRLLSGAHARILGQAPSMPSLADDASDIEKQAAKSAHDAELRMRQAMAPSIHLQPLSDAEVEDLEVWAWGSCPRAFLGVSEQRQGEGHGVAFDFAAVGDAQRVALEGQRSRESDHAVRVLQESKVI